MTDWRACLAVVVGAGFGGLTRYVVAIWFLQRFGSTFPFGTLFINISGSFLIGFIVQASQSAAFGLTPLMRLLLATGFCGGYTTFSAFSFEMLTLGSERLASALAYGGSSVVLGVLSTYLGILLARVTGAWR